MNEKSMMAPLEANPLENQKVEKTKKKDKRKEVGQVRKPKENVSQKTKEEKRISRRNFLKFGIGITGTAATHTAAYKGVKKGLDWVGRQGVKEPKGEKEEEKQMVVGAGDVDQETAKEHGIEKEQAPNNQRREEESSTNSEQERTEEKKEKARNIADFYLDAYFEVAKTNLWQKKVLTESMFMAQQMQESGYEADAESKMNAVGVMQTRGISIEDVTTYLVRLRDTGKIEYNGPEKLSDKQIKEIKELIKEDISGDYGRSIGKIYMVMLSDSEFGYGVAEEAIKAQDYRKAQKEVLAAYNGGLGNVTYRKKGEKIRKTRPENAWPDETKGYYKKIFNYEKRIENIKLAFKEKGLDEPNNREIKNIALEMNKYKGEEKYKWLQKYVKRYLVAGL